jgi:hypothetical protein
MLPLSIEHALLLELQPFFLVQKLELLQAQ